MAVGSAHLQKFVVVGMPWHDAEGAVAQYEFVLVEEVIPDGQSVAGMQNMSALVPPMLYH